MEDDGKIKVVVIGPSGVGKTGIFQRYCYSKYDSGTEVTVSTGVHEKRVRHELSQRDFDMTIWDTAGQERYESLIGMYMRRANYALLCYDITLKETFDKLENYAEMLPEDCNRIVVGCKSDLVIDKITLRKVSKEQLIEKTNSPQLNAFDHFECSALANINIDAIFQKCLDHYVLHETDLEQDKIAVVQIGKGTPSSTSNKCKC